MSIVIFVPFLSVLRMLALTAGYGTEFWRDDFE